MLNQWSEEICLKIKYIASIDKLPLYGSGVPALPVILMQVNDTHVMGRALTKLVSRTDFTEAHFNYLISKYEEFKMYERHDVDVIKNKLIEEGSKRGFKVLPGHYEYNELIVGNFW